MQRRNGIMNVRLQKFKNVQGVRYRTPFLFVL